MPENKKNSSTQQYLKNMFNREETLRAAVFRETAEVQRDDLYNSLCRYIRAGKMGIVVYDRNVNVAAFLEVKT